MSITFIIAVITAIISFVAFSKKELVDNLIFYPYRMWRYHEWHRLFGCSFIHADGGHLLFNMIAFWSFGEYVEKDFSLLFPLGGVLYVTLYFGAVALADVYNLFRQKNNPGYRSLGASGGVSAVVFASILLHPSGGISIMFLPSIPAYIFGPLYLVYCVYMAKRGGDHIGHMAHFTGSVIGFVFPILLKPSLLSNFFYQIFGN
jgi:membrane associated rhomboid family serine protease